MIFERLMRSLPGRYTIRKMRFDLEPHIGAGDLKLGMTREETRAILGKSAYSSEKSVMDYGDFSIPIPAKDGYFKNELQITFDDNGKVDFIEFSGKDSEFVEVYLKDIEVFKIRVRITCIHRSIVCMTGYSLVCRQILTRTRSYK